MKYKNINQFIRKISNFVIYFMHLDNIFKIKIVRECKKYIKN